jgi:uncharacterized protein (DUF58 family)
MIGGRFTRSAARSTPEPLTSGAHTDDGAGLVRVDVKSLIALRTAAAAVPLKTGKIRSLQSGNYYSPFKGRGMEFDEVRAYQPGDDVRSIDWRVTARSGKPHTKLFREERERSVIVWVDYRSPMFFATQGAFKSVVAARLASIVAWSAIHHGDRLGGLIFSETEHQEIRPQRSKQSVLHLLQRLSDHPARQNQNSLSQAHHETLQQALGRLRRVARPGSLLVLLSDFRGLDAQAQSHLAQLARHNDVMLVFLYDALEAMLPPAGLYRIGMSGHTTAIDTGSKNARQQYELRFHQRLEQVRRLSARYRMNFMLCSTTDDALATLQQGLGTVTGSKR